MIKGRITALWNVQPKLLLFVYESFGALCRYFTYVQFRSLTEWVAVASDGPSLVDEKDEAKLCEHVNCESSCLSLTIKI